jgi:hypothetical protein
VVADAPEERDPALEPREGEASTRPATPVAPQVRRHR